MGNRLSPNELELYRRVDEVLHYLWDPIGVSLAPEARDEYYSYLPRVYSLLQKTTDGKDISEYLISIEQDSMGMTITEHIREHASEIANILIRYRELITKKNKNVGSN